MKIRKVNYGYYVDSKFYTKKDFFWLIMTYVLVAIMVLAFVGSIISWGLDRSKARKLANSDDPVGNLILALEEKPGWTAARHELNKIGDPLLIALAPACEGEAVSSSLYDPIKPGPHPLVLLLPDGMGLYQTYIYLKEWGPTSRQPEEVQLVVCAYEFERKLSGCSYGNGVFISRIQKALTLNVIKAASGDELVKKVFYGSTPKCPGTVSSSVADRKPIEGSSVDYSDVRDFLQDLYQ